MLQITKAAISTILIVLAAGCASSQKQTAADATSLAQPFSAEHYAVSPTDVLRVDIYRELDLSGEYYVDPSGTINMPLLGRVNVVGLNIKAIEYRLKQELSQGYIVDPDVRVSVIRFRPIYVTGEVNKPGEFRFTPGMTVQQAVVLAGGPTRFAADKYYLQRMNSSQSGNIRVDGDSVLFPGDVITVGERLF